MSPWQGEFRARYQSPRRLSPRPHVGGHGRRAVSVLAHLGSHVVERPEVTAVLGTGVLVRIGNQSEVADYASAVQTEKVLPEPGSPGTDCACRGEETVHDLLEPS